jgi:uncharacterized Zn finger protein (UPF0148 family)
MTDKNKEIDDTTEEQLSGDNCPICGYPIVIEQGLEVCYRCGWYKGCESIEGYYEQ